MPSRVLPFTMTHSPAVPRPEPPKCSPALVAIIEDLQVIDRLSPQALDPIGRLARQLARGLRHQAAERAESQ
jgi:hypothetical protein